MPCEISKDDSKIQSKVIAKIKSYSAALAKQNGWLQIVNWQKPGDGWYNQIEDGAMIDIQVEFLKSQQQVAYLVWFEGVPKGSGPKLRSRVGSLPYKMPAGT